MTTIQNPTSIHKSNSYPNTNDQSKTPIQRSPECSLIRAFVAHPITATPVSHHKSNEYPQIQFLSKHQRPIQNSNPTLSRMQSDRGFCSPANHPYTWFQLPVVKTDRGMQISWGG